MNVRKSVIALSLLAGVTSICAMPQYRLVSGDRGVILSVENVSAEPEVQVELIDGNLAVSIKDESKDSLFSNSISFPEGFWADSLVQSYSEGNAQLMFYNFALSIEDMQKKYSSSRLLLLISPAKSTAFDKVLFDGAAGTGAVISDLSASNRDGLEFITLSGMNLKKASVVRNEQGVLVQFPDGLDIYKKSIAIPEEFLVDSIQYTMTGSGIPAVQFYATDGYLSLMETAAKSVKLVFADNREKDEVTVSTWASESELLRFALDETRGASAEVAQVDEPVVVEESVQQNVVEEVVEEKIPEEPKVLFLVKNDVNVRSTPSTKTSENVIGKFPLGTRMVSDVKEGAWYKVTIGDTVDGWIYSSLVEDSANITDEQWDAIYNSQTEKAATPVVDEFNSPGEDPLLADNKKDVFTLDSTKNEHAKTDSSSLDEPEVTKKKDVVIKPYKKYGRDPFLPLTTSDFVKPKLPKLDNLTLVGIIYDPSEGIALFEELVDGEMVSFSMRPGEKVENGKLLRIYESKVVFLMHESDISFTVEKELLEKKE